MIDGSQIIRPKHVIDVYMIVLLVQMIQFVSVAIRLQILENLMAQDAYQ